MNFVACRLSGLLKGKLTSLVEQKQTKEFYATAEVAELLGRAEFTVREWCRLGRVLAEKRLRTRLPPHCCNDS